MKFHCLWCYYSKFGCRERSHKQARNDEETAEELSTLTADDLFIGLFIFAIHNKSQNKEPTEMNLSIVLVMPPSEFLREFN